MKKSMYAVIAGFLIISFSSCNGNENISESTGGEISPKKIEKLVQKGEPVLFSGKTITGDIVFTEFLEGDMESTNIYRTKVSSPITFINCTFKGKISAYSKDGENTRMTIFDRNVSFISCDFKEEVTFKEVHFRESVNFNNSFFHKTVNFEGAQFDFKSIYLTRCEFFEELRFQRAIFSGHVSFLKTKFNGVTSFQNTCFEGNAQFGAAVFLSYTNFGDITALQGIFFNYCEFSEVKATLFSNSEFRGRAEFLDCKFKQRTDFSNSVFYGITKFSKSTISGNLIFENTRFIFGKPDTKDITQENADCITVANSVYYTNQPLELTDF